MVSLPTALHLAALEGWLDEVRRLVSLNPSSVDDTTSAGDTPLLLAASKRPAVVAFLLDARANPNLGTGSGWSPLHAACHACNLECVQLLVGAGADPRAQTTQGESSLDVATKQIDQHAYGSIDTSRLLRDLERAPLLCADVSIIGSDYEGEPGVVVGFDQLQEEYLVALLDNTAVVRAGAGSVVRRQWDWVPTQRARRNACACGVAAPSSTPTVRPGKVGSIPVGAAPQPHPPLSRTVEQPVEQPVEQQPPPTLRPPRLMAVSKNAHGHHTCARCSRDRTTARLRPGSRGGVQGGEWGRPPPPPLPTVGAPSSHSSSDSSSDVSPQPSHGSAAGGAAPRDAYQQAVSTFLQRAWERERSPLHAAAAMGHVALLRRLLGCCAAVDKTTASGEETALHLAAASGVLAATAMLLDASACVNAQNRDGDRPLHIAAWAGDEATLSLLLERGAQLDAPGHRGERALTVAAIRSQEDATRLLLESDADVDAADAHGTLPALAAAQHGASRAVLRALKLDLRRHPEAADALRASRLEPSEAEAATLAQLDERWRKRSQALLPCSQRLLVHNAPPAEMPAEAVLMEAMSTNLASDQLEKWRQACATLAEASGASMLRVPAALDRSACAALRRGVDTYGKVNNDTVDNVPNIDWPMTAAELKAVIGEPAARALFSLPQRFHARSFSNDPTGHAATAAGTQPLEPTRIFARRYSASGDDEQRWTSFHFDAAHTTINVALTDDDDFTGGRLLGLVDGAVRTVRRAEGDATVHTSSMLHGVSRMTSGVRYSLICFVPGAVGRPRNYVYLAGSCSLRSFF